MLTVFYAGLSVVIFLHRYTPSDQGVMYNSGAKQRVIRMVEAQRDPMEPPRFKWVVIMQDQLLGLGLNVFQMFTRKMHSSNLKWYNWSSANGTAIHEYFSVLYGFRGYFKASTNVTTTTLNMGAQGINTNLINFTNNMYSCIVVQ